MSTLRDQPGAREIAETCLCFQTQRAARALARRFDAAFRPLGITNGQFSLMTMLSGAEARRMKDVADFLTMDRTTLTAALKKLERDGLVVVAADPKDRRGRLVSLTAKGRRTLDRAKPVWCTEHARLEAERDIDATELRRNLKALA
jgi:DNA-binding MarR family transcriptional regulator